MSRVGKKEIIIPNGVNVKIDDNHIDVKGPKGSLSFDHSRESKVEVSDNTISVANVGKTKNAPALWGTTRSVLMNMIVGVTEGYEKQLELQGVGYKMAIQGKKFIFNLGFSHPVEKVIPEGIEASIEKNILIMKGIDKQKVGQLAAEIKDLKPVEPYKGKGFRYVGEIVMRKEGKRAAGEK